MTITSRDNHIIVTFSQSDWRNHKSGVESIIAAMKAHIPSGLRSYSLDTREWTIDAIYRDKIEELRNEFLVDRNQQSLFW